MRRVGENKLGKNKEGIGIRIRNFCLFKMGRFSDVDLKEMPEHEIFFEFIFENWVSILGGFVGSKACSLYYFEK